MDQAPSHRTIPFLSTINVNTIVYLEVNILGYI